MPYQMLMDAARGRAPILHAPEDRPIVDNQFQPATLDLRLGEKIYALSGAFLPQPGQTVESLIERYSQYSFDLQPEKTHHLDVGKTYIAPLLESCAFPGQVRGSCSPKSSIGRTDLFVRVVADGYPHFNRIPAGYQGKLWLQFTPLSFYQGVRIGLSPIQMRLKTNETRVLSDDELMRLHMKHGIVYDKGGNPLDHKTLRIERGRFYFHVDLNRDVVGLRARRRVRERLDLIAAGGTYEPRDFWEPIFRPNDDVLVLDPGEFYLLATKERVRIPPSCCGEILEYDVTTGEFRVHYAGFFDNGFGGDTGTNGVLEMRARDVPFFIVDGQPICAMEFEETFGIPAKLYGDGNNYPRPEPSLAKYFKNRYEAWELDYWRSVP